MGAPGHLFGTLYVYRDEDGDAAAVSRWAKGPNGGLSADAIARMHIPTPRLSRDEINRFARMFAAAPDHALIAWALCMAGARWEAWRDGQGEFCIDGIRHCTKLDEFGVPTMTDGMRAAIAQSKAQGEG
ncbi:MAG: hypothetical protein J7500_15605 [Sphingomonas sp.]|uniref:hypothetical protein n=1 Tax=Sphingomonas sp. TaxID=28214 RepID=UPI001B14841D|nr:hypothetical protein [Sphingomonas sp.]MBO9624133.1 hypothetical protein [Sphingomonas sp.]